MKEDLNYQVELIERVKKELGISNTELSKKLKIVDSFTELVSENIRKRVKNL